MNVKKDRRIRFWNYMGRVCLFNAALLWLPLGVGVFYPHTWKEAYAFIGASLLIALIGGLVLFAFRRQKPVSAMTYSESGTIVVCGWAVTCLLSALPFVFAGQLNMTQAIFEAVSGWTTTGLSVVDIEATSEMFLMWRSLMQYFGGAGIAVVALATVIGPTGKSFYSAEGRRELLLPNVFRSAKVILTIYTVWIALGSAVYTALGMPLFDAINHAIAALSTGGFSTKSESIGAYSSAWIEWTTIVLMLAGTTHFAAHFLLIRKRGRQFLNLTEVRVMAVVLTAAVPIAVYSLGGFYDTLSKTVRVSFFELVSALTTTGFSTVSYAAWPELLWGLMLVLMLIGGGTGSTAGGIKQLRIGIVAKAVWQHIKGTEKPPCEIAVSKPEGRIYLKDREVNDVFAFVALYCAVFVLGSAVMVAHGYSLKAALFEYASTLGTVGLSVGVTSADAPLGVLWVQIVGMFLGRLELIVVFVALSKVARRRKSV